MDLHKNFVTPTGTGSYVNLAEMSEIPNGTMAYNMALLIPKSDEAGIKAIKGAIVSAFKDKFGEDKAKQPKVWHNPLHDGDLKDNSEGTPYEGCYYLNLKTTRAPGIVGPNGRPLMDVDNEVYSGMQCRCSVNFYGFDAAGKKGVGVGLNNVMKTGDGERLDGRKAAEAEFAEFATESDSADDDDILDS